MHRVPPSIAAPATPFRHCVALLVAAVAAAAATLHERADAETLTFTAEVNGATRVATVNSQDVDGVSYVPLLELVTQLGGGFDLLFSRVHVEIAGHSAYVPFNDRAIDASGARFTLLRPVVREGGNVLVARQDVATLFGKAFELVVADQAGPTASVPITPIEKVPGDVPRTVVPVAEPAVVVRPIKTVIIDPGHGGLDRGVNGRAIVESELTLAVAKTLRNTLANAGLSVVLTREENVNRAITERAKVANDEKGDVLITLHAGASFAPNAHGVEIFYATLGTEPAAPPTVGAAFVPPSPRAHPYAKQSQRFAQLLAATVRDGASTDIRGVHGSHLRLHKTVDMPGVLLEMGVLTNPADEAVLEKDAYHQSIAQAILAAIRQYNAEAPDR